MQQTFLIADTHFGHKRIIEYDEHRQNYTSLHEMDEAIIKNWNKVIKRNYIVYILGDVSFYPKEKTKEIINRLNGNKYLIMGNHDTTHSVNWWKEVGFEWVSKYPIIFEDKYILSHIPIFRVGDAPQNLFWNVHGHLSSHGSLYNNDTHYSVSMHMGYDTPINLKKIKKYFEEEI
jgi:calcineurin-like phosphoesterase family protein